MKIAFFDTKPYDERFFSQILGEYDFKVKFFENKLNEDTYSLAKGYDCVCAFVNDTLNKEVIDGLVEGGVRLVAMRCAGYNNVDFKASHGRLRVVRVPAYSPYAVAEHAAALMVTLNRKTHKAHNRTRESNFNINGLLGFDLHGRTLGIIGTGKIGQIFGDIGKGYGMKVIAYDKFPDDSLDIEYVELDELYKQADIISMHCPLLKDTHHMINAESIDKMKDGVMIINTSRGGLIDSESLIEAIKTRKVGSAGLDVYEEEEDYFFEDFSDEIITDDVLARLLSFNNVLVTSHQAFFTQEALSNISRTTLDNIKAFTEGEELVNEICYICDKNGKNCKTVSEK